MKNSKIIAKRFSPANTNPVFFCGRHKIITDMFLDLNNFVQNPFHFQRHLHLLVGSSGVGKTALLKYLYRQVLNSKEMTNYIPLYICMKGCENEQDVYLSIVTGLEQSCRQSPYRYQQLERVLKAKTWLNKALLVAPDLANYLRKDMVEFSFFEFLHCLEKNPCPKPMTVDLIKLIQLFARECSLYIFLIFDHMPEILYEENLQGTFSNCFSEMEKYNSRFFSVISMDEEYFYQVKKDRVCEHSGVSRLLQHSNLFVLQKDAQLTSGIEKIIDSTKSGEKFSIFALAPNCDLEKVTASLKTRLVAEFEMVTLQCETDNFETFLRTACDIITEKCENTQKKLLGSLPHTAKILKREIHRQRDLDNVLDYFGQLLLRLDGVLQDSKLAIVMENYEQFIQQERTFSSIKKTNMKEHMALPSPTFIKFYNALLSFSAKCKNIHIIPILRLTPTDQVFYEKSVAYNLLFNSYIWNLRYFSKENTCTFLHEVFNRCGIVLRRKTLEDIHDKTAGIPLILHLIGYYITSFIEKNLIESDVVMLQGNLMSKNEVNDITLTVGELKKYEDDRLRIEINRSICDQLEQKSLDKMYQELWSDVLERVDSKFLKLVMREDIAISALEKKYPHQETMLEIIKFLKVEGFVEEKNKHLYVHELLRQSFSVYKKVSPSIRGGEVNQTRRNSDVGLKKIKHETRRNFSFGEQIIRLKEQHRIRPTERKERQDIKPGSSNDTKIFHLENEQQQNSELMKYMALALDEGPIPTRTTLEKISEKIDVAESYSLEYLQILCRKICEMVNVSSSKYFNAVVGHFTKHQNLYIAVNSTFCSENTINACLMGKKYEQLYLLYKLKYNLEGSQKYLQKSIEFAFQFLYKSINEEKAQMYISDMISLVSKIEDKNTRKNLQEVTDYYYKFIKSIHYKDDSCIPMLLTRQVPKPFLPFLVNCCVFTLEKNIGENTNIACLKLMLTAPQSIKKDNLALQKILPVLSTHSNENVRYSFYDFLIYVIPLLELELRKEVFILLLEASQQEQNNVQKKVIEVINSYILLMPEEETFFLLQNMIGDGNCDLDTWSTIVRLWNILPKTAQQELQGICIKFYAENTDKFATRPSKSIPFLPLIDSGKAILYDYVVQQLHQGNVAALPHLNRILCDLDLEESQQNMIHRLMIEMLHELPNEEQSSFLHYMCNRNFSPQHLLLFRDLENQVEYLCCQLYFFAKYSAEDQQQIISRAKAHLTDSDLLVHSFCQVIAYCSEGDLIDIQKTYANFIAKHGVHNNISQQMIRSAKHIVAKIPGQADDLLKQAFSYLLEKEQSIMFPVILEGVKCFPSDISLGDIQQAVSNVFVLQNSFSPTAMRNFYEFLDCALGFGMRHSLVEKIQKALHEGMNDYKYADIAIPIYLKHFRDYDMVIDLLNTYQLNVHTWHISFAFFDIVPDKLQEIPKLSTNYEQVENLEKLYLHCNIIDIYYRIGEKTLAEEKLNLLLKNAIIPSYRRRILRIQQKWSMKLQLSEAYTESSIHLRELL
ncbi:hypothetical protein [Candidatus Uabimicrobium amorphum]|uniref:Uncharacterized protein n=1 Tax=Uabimicrobium amorphum TaxID=2596890 RepID=A0A5S9ITP0_UABAM|nr:hypothetical protein [Candidatus Uabimicrobium amorphum]BBM86425.1 hypothetical protein UABAM_04811 [Candidatus Uabimicrobium amorphum]